MYKFKKAKRSELTSVPVLEGETIEQKIERIVENKEPITDGAPEIYTERKEGIVSAYNIRTDRWEIAADAMDAVQRSIAAKREAKAKEGVIQLDPEKGKKDVGEAKPIQGQGQSEGAAKTE